jgi:hypothetical protein
MKKIIVVSIITIIVLAPVVFVSFSFINKRIKENNADRQPESITLIPVDNFSGKIEEATREYTNKIFRLQIKARINDPDPKKFYEVWLAKDFPYNSLLSLGILKKDGLYYKLEYTSPVNKYLYDRIMITEESLDNGLDGKPGKRIFENIVK